jgi:hypothetical protein
MRKQSSGQRSNVGPAPKSDANPGMKQRDGGRIKPLPPKKATEPKGDQSGELAILLFKNLFMEPGARKGGQRLPKQG